MGRKTKYIDRNNSNKMSAKQLRATMDYADLLDDRQGMNDSEQQFTKGEKAGRPSIDESIISERLDNDKKSIRKSLLRNNNGSQGNFTSNARSDSKSIRRSKSPSGYMYTSGKRSRSRRGLFGLASRLKLTKRHESIEGFQLSVLNSGFLSLKKLDRDLASFLPKDRLSPSEFDARVKLMRKYPVLAKIEYKFASRYEIYVSRHALVEENQLKNNSKRCIPYDYNRVVLKTLPGKPNSDYINASHVDSFIKPNAYIAAQGPNENTTGDFWRMVWEQKTFVVVMLTKVFDFIKVMCNQYWPVEVGKSELYGNLEVTLLYEEPLADFVIRTIKLTKLKTVSKTPGGPSNSGQQQQQPQQQQQQLGVRDAGSDEEARLKELEDDDEGCNRYIMQLTGADGDELEDFDDVALDRELMQRSTGESAHSEILASGVGGEAASGAWPRQARVRSPKFVIPGSSPKSAGSSTRLDGPARARKSLHQRRTTDRNSLSLRLEPARQVRSHSTASGQLAPSSDSPRRVASQTPRPVTASGGDLLHPLSFTGRNQLGGSLSSLASQPNTPTSPMTPSTASGIDRLSNTRKAVKKKRRVREKSSRPVRTEFQVPDESQLMDDDDDDDEIDDDGDAAAIRDQTASATGGEQLDGSPFLSADQEQHQQQTPSQQTSGRQTRQSNQVVASERIIYQFHYNGWASHTCPFISSLLHFRRRVRICMDEMAKSGKTGPTIVHCNDGCGRTGSYLNIDANLELVEEDNVYDVFNYTKKLRQSRKLLIESLEQYKFVYDTIEEAQFCGKTWFPISELHKRLKHKSQRNTLNKKNEYQIEYEKICSMTSKFSIGDCAGGHRVENREKNRDVSTVPPDNFRPYLTSFQTNDSTDYINAVFVDGYTRSKEYIVTEWPLYKTISDFWSLIYDHDCNSVILLANPQESTKYPSFLPSEKELRRKFGPVFSAEMVSYTHYQNIKSWIYTINKKIVSLTEVIAGVKSEAKTTQVFQITCWPQGHRVPTSTNALVELMNMVERWRQRTAYGPVCVVSLNGKSRAGVYCAANVAIEQVVQHGEVDVFQAVKTVRRHRPQLIENMTEYKYCYDLILHYVLYYLNQANQTA